MLVASILATTIYLLLTIAALLSTICPPLKALASHGKTRVSNGDCNSDNDDASVDGYFLTVYNFLLTGLTVNKCRFIDFYASGIITTLAVVYTETTNKGQWGDGIISMQTVNQWLPTILLMIHLIRRYCECKWIQKSGTSSKMHLAGYLLGILHYLCLPFVLVPHQFEVCAAEDNDDGSKSDEVCQLNSTNSGDAYSTLGIVLLISTAFACIYFQYEQHRHHVILANLRSNKSKPTTYSIPSGRWFEYVSCPHYLSEIMIYCMLILLMTNKPTSVGESDIKAHLEQLSYTKPIFISDNFGTILVTIYKTKHWILLIWVATNLSISANSTHNWYLYTFEATYPRQRSRLIPLLW